MYIFDIYKKKIILKNAKFIVESVGYIILNENLFYVNLSLYYCRYKLHNRSNDKLWSDRTIWYSASTIFDFICVKYISHIFMDFLIRVDGG